MATLERYGRPPPDEYLARPRLNRALTLLLDLFWEAATERRFEGAPIPASAIRAAAADFGINDQEDVRRVRLLLRRLDAEYLEHRADMSRKQSEAVAARAKGRGRRSASALASGSR